MKHFAIMTNQYKDKQNLLANKIMQYITAKGGVCGIYNLVDGHTNRFRKIRVDEVPETVECIITIGGDGTLLHTAKDFKSKDVFLIGVNKGTLGFLAEISQNQMKTAIDRLLVDDFHVESRMMLQGEVLRGGEAIYAESVLNDIVIHRGEDLAAMSFDVFVNGQMLGKYNSDGLILSTPTGSTAYNLSAGGPVARPDSHLMIMTPICAHSIGNKSIIFSKEDIIEVQIKAAKLPDIEYRKVCFDGDSTVNIITGDVIRIKNAKEQTKIIKLDTGSFLQTIQDKLTYK